MGKDNIETLIDPKIIEVSCKVSEVGKVTFTLETKKDVSKLFKKAVDTGLKLLQKELEKLVEAK